MDNACSTLCSICIKCIFYNLRYDFFRREKTQFSGTAKNLSTNGHRYMMISNWIKDVSGLVLYVAVFVKNHKTQIKNEKNHVFAGFGADSYIDSTCAITVWCSGPDVLSVY